MKTWISGFFFFLAAFFVFSAEAQISGFVSIDCGSTESFTDELGLQWIPDPLMYGKVAHLSVANETRRQYKTLRYFPPEPDDRKYCYTLDVQIRKRYLLRASFLYGKYDNNNVYPKFDISVGATPWSTVIIMNPDEAVVMELIFLALEPTVSLCLSNASTGAPFISTLELRQFNGSMYYTNYETQFYLGVSARINFGADGKDPVRYPDDPYDRIWESDSKKANYLVDVAAGTEKVSTNKPIYTDIKEMPPQRVMQTAVVGRNGSLSYRTNLEGFPAQGWAFCYFAEIEELGSHDVRKFRLNVPGLPKEDSRLILNIVENAGGKYRLYEPGLPNVSLPYIVNFGFNKTADSTLGPILNAIEISSYIKRSHGSTDGSVMASFVSHNSTADWAQEGGDPCLPVPWTWLTCNSDSQPLITKVKLSGKNLTGNIPSELTQLSGLEELWLGGNSLMGSIPDFSGCPNLKIIHLEDNQLTGNVPSSLAQLANLRELYLQDNQLSGELPSALLDRNLIFNYTGNVNLHEGGSKRNLIIGVSVGATFLILAAIVGCILLCRRKKPGKKFFDHGKGDNMGRGISVQELSSSSAEPTPETAHCFSALEIEEATRKFERKIGSGGFGVVYYGKLKDGREIAVKVLTSNSYQSQREFSNEVTLLSRIHHRNLLQFIGYCQEDGKSILIYEFMHNGTLKEHLYGPLIRGQTINWVKRLEIAEDAARGTEYLHTGCVPSIIHRDLKTSNILLDMNMRAKVSDFGLSKFTVDGKSHVSSMVRGTIGYLDPEYYISQKLTTKSDVYSFGVILLELISGQEPVSKLNFDASCCNIIDWAKYHIEKGDLQKIIDPALQGEYDIQSMWKIAEKALMCVLPHGYMRPTMAEVLKEIQDAILIERERDAVRSVNSDDIVSRHLLNSPAKLTGLVDFGPGENNVSFETSMEFPKAR